MKSIKTFAKAAVVWSLAGAVSGCGDASTSANGFGSRLYDSGASLFSGNHHPPPNRHLHATPPSPAAQYRYWNLKMDAAYRRLSSHMDLAAQLAFSSEQTAWLNERVKTCMRTGTLDYGCAIHLTRSRVATLRARPLTVPPVLANQPPPAALPAAAPPIRPQAASTAAAGAGGPRSETKTPASGHIYAVAVTAMPWIWRNGGVNQNFSFGYPNGTPPTRVPLAAEGAAPGDLVTIKYNGGRIVIGAGGPSADGNGFAGLFANGARSQLGAFPSSYMHPYPINLGALVGAFTDNNGTIIGQPFAINDGTRQPVPPGATQLQLGINDDNFGGTTKDSQNSGGFTVSVAVTKAKANAVP